SVPGYPERAETAVGLPWKFRESPGCRRPDPGAGTSSFVPNWTCLRRCDIYISYTDSPPDGVTFQVNLSIADGDCLPRPRAIAQQDAMGDCRGQAETSKRIATTLHL